MLLVNILYLTCIKVSLKETILLFRLRIYNKDVNILILVALDLLFLSLYTENQ